MIKCSFLFAHTPINRYMRGRISKALNHRSIGMTLTTAATCTERENDVCSAFGSCLILIFNLYFQHQTRRPAASAHPLLLFLSHLLCPHRPDILLLLLLMLLLPRCRLPPPAFPPATWSAPGVKRWVSNCSPCGMRVGASKHFARRFASRNAGGPLLKRIR